MRETRMIVPERIKIDGEYKDLSWITNVTNDNDIRAKMLIAGLCKRALTGARAAVTKQEMSSICKVLPEHLSRFLERYGEDFYINMSQPLPEVIHLNGHVFKSRAGFENQCYFRNIDGVLFDVCRAILEDAKIDPQPIRLIAVCNIISALLHKVFTENARELFCVEIREDVTPVSTPIPYINVPKSIAISGRVINIEWISRAYDKDPDKMQERFIFCVVQEILRTLPFNRIPSYRSEVVKTISNGLHAFLEQYAHLIFNPDKGTLYGSVADLPDDIEICGRLWGIRWLKSRHMNNKTAISELISKVATICLGENSAIRLDFVERGELVKSFATKFCQFLELNAEDLFGNGSATTSCEMDLVNKSIADAQSELQVFIEDFTELRKDLGDVMQEVRLLKTTESKVLADENAVLKQKVEFLSDENRRLKECVAALILKETLQLYLDQD